MGATKRIAWVDLCKYLAMMLVVLLHFGVPKKIDDIVHLFHMPIFYILSGFCLNLERYPKFLPFFLSRMKSLIIPYISFSLVFYLLWSGIFAVMSPQEIVPISQYLMSHLITNTTAVKNLWGGVQWFLTSLFFTELLFWFCKKVTKKYSLILIACIVCIGFCFAMYSKHRLPLAIDTSMVMLLFYALGNSLKRTAVLEKIRNQSLLALAVLQTLLVLITYIIYRLVGTTNVRMMKFGNPIFYVIGALIGSFGVIVASWIVEALFSNNKRYWDKVLYVGRNTIIILYIHRLFIGIINVFIYPHIQFVGHMKYMASILLTVFFFMVLAFPSCRWINRYVPFLVGKIGKRTNVS